MKKLEIYNQKLIFICASVQYNSRAIYYQVPVITKILTAPLTYFTQFSSVFLLNKLMYNIVKYAEYNVNFIDDLNTQTISN